jgi:hypothetical protein
MYIRRQVATLLRLTAAMASAGLLFALACGDSSESASPADAAAADGGLDAPTDDATPPDGGADASASQSAYCAALEAARTRCGTVTTACLREQCKQLEATVTSEIAKSAFIECTSNQSECMTDGGGIDGSKVFFPPQIQCQVDKKFASPPTAAERAFAQHYCANCAQVQDKALCEKGFFEATDGNGGEILIGQDLKGYQDPVVSKLDTECTKPETFDAGGLGCYVAYDQCRKKVLQTVLPAPCGDE